MIAALAYSPSGGNNDQKIRGTVARSVTNPTVLEPVQDSV